MPHLIVLESLGDPSAGVDVREVHFAAGTQHPVCLADHAALVGTQVHGAVRDDQVDAVVEDASWCQQLNVAREEAHVALRVPQSLSELVGVPASDLRVDRRTQHSGER